MSIEHLRNIREYELGKVVSLMPQHAKILEVGAGAGWQAKALSEKGFDVEAIDVEGSVYAGHRIWPVVIYDAVTIPFPDQSFDIVFSSSVLEHIPHMEKFSTEIKRVLKPGGTAIHIMPTGLWRFWTGVSHYLFSGKVFLFVLLVPLRRIWDPADEAVKMSKMKKRGLLRWALFPVRHGNRGNAVSEIYFFSKCCWKSFFRKAGWITCHYARNRLFYTGYSVLDSLLTIRFRHLLSYLLGSSCHVFALKRKREDNGMD